MKCYVPTALLGLSCPLACFGFVPHQLRVPRIIAPAKKAALLQPLQVVSDLKIPKPTKSDEKDAPFTIPLEEICLDDIPKVGGYVKR